VVVVVVVVVLVVVVVVVSESMLVLVIGMTSVDVVDTVVVPGSDVTVEVNVAVAKTSEVV